MALELKHLTGHLILLLSSCHGPIRREPRRAKERQSSALRYAEIKRSMALWVIRGPRGLDGERDR
jgi:hypothetical protein